MTKKPTKRTQIYSRLAAERVLAHDPTVDYRTFHSIFYSPNTPQGVQYWSQILFEMFGRWPKYHPVDYTKLPPEAEAYIRYCLRGAKEIDPFIKDKKNKQFLVDKITEV